MSAFNKDSGRHASAVQIREEMEEGNYRPITAKITSRHCASDETAEQRRTRHAEATGTRRGLWK
jgi:hypothetical protein